MLTELTVKNYAEKLASKEAAPGGGSAAALFGLSGVSLLEMVINLTLGREGFAAYEALLEERKLILAGLHAELEELIDRDAEAFNGVMDAFKLPKGTEEEKAARSAAIQQGYKEAAEVPLKTARGCLEALEIAQMLLGKVNPHAVSDLAVGALAAHAGVISALLNTAINLPSIKEAAYVKALNGQMHLIKTAANDMLADIQKQVYQDDCFEELR